MKAKPLKFIEGGYIPCNPDVATHVVLEMPGPISYRMIPVITSGDRAGTPCWTWNGSIDKPTLKPSILTRAYDGPNVSVLCHSFVTDGMVRFLKDCTHEFAGKTVELLDVNW